MKVFKAVGLCLAAVLAIGAAVAGSASAVTVTILFPSGGNTDFSAKAGPGKLVGENGKLTIECKKGTSTGEAVAGTDRVKNVFMTIEGCEGEIKATKVKCNTTGFPADTIRSNQLEGEFGSNGEKTGLVLKSVTELFAEFTCATSKVKMRGKERGTSGERGGIVAEILPESINKLIDVGSSAKLTLKQAVAEPTRQAITELSVLGTNVAELLLELSAGSGFSVAGIEGSDDGEVFGLASFEISRK